MNRLTIDFPDDMLVATGSTWTQLEHEARLAMAAKLYELGRLSSGKAAVVAGMDRATFLLSLHRVGVAAIQLDDRDWIDEREYARGE